MLLLYTFLHGLSLFLANGPLNLFSTHCSPVAFKHCWKVKVGLFLGHQDLQPVQLGLELGEVESLVSRAWSIEPLPLFLRPIQDNPAYVRIMLEAHAVRVSGQLLAYHQSVDQCMSDPSAFQLLEDGLVTRDCKMDPLSIPTEVLSKTIRVSRGDKHVLQVLDSQANV